MKKIVSIALALVLVLSLSVSAFAVGSPVAAGTSDAHTAPKFIVVSAKSGDKDANIIVTEFDKRDKLDANAKKIFEDAYKVLADAAPADADMISEFFVNIESDILPVTVTFKESTAKEALIKLFKDGAWGEIDSTVNGDGTISMVMPNNGPIAVFVNK